MFAVALFQIAGSSVIDSIPGSVALKSHELVRVQLCRACHLLYPRRRGAAAGGRQWLRLRRMRMASLVGGAAAAMAMPPTPLLRLYSGLVTPSLQRAFLKRSGTALPPSSTLCSLSALQPAQALTCIRPGLPTMYSRIRPASA